MRIQIVGRLQEGIAENMALEARQLRKDVEATAVMSYCGLMFAVKQESTIQSFVIVSLSIYKYDTYPQFILDRL